MPFTRLLGLHHSIHLLLPGVFLYACAEYNLAISTQPDQTWDCSRDEENRKEAASESASLPPSLIPAASLRGRWQLKFKPFFFPANEFQEESTETVNKDGTWLREIFFLLFLNNSRQDQAAVA